MGVQRIAEFVGLNLKVEQYEGIVDMMPMHRRKDTACDLERLAERAAWLAAYMNERGGSDLQDRGHKAAVRKARQAAKRVWREVFRYLAVKL